MNLTDRAIRTLPLPERGNRICYDDHVKGFGLRLTAGGARAFVLNYWFEGRERRMTIGGWPDFTATAARDMAREALQTIARGTDPLAVREARRVAPDIVALCADYLTHHAEAHKRPRSVANDRAMIDRFIKPKLGSLRVAAVTTRDIADMHRSISATPYQANRVLALVSKMLSLSAQWGWRGDNPARGVVKNREEARERALRPDESAGLAKAIEAWRAADPTRRARSADAIEMLLLTGARRSEVLGMRWDQIDLDTGTWTKPAAFTKQKKKHVAPLIPPAVSILHRVRDRDASELSEWVFPGNRDDKPLQDVKKAWRQILDIAGLDRVRLHDLRHSYVTSLVIAGVPLELAGQMVGHTQTATTRRYAHPDIEALRAVAAKAHERWMPPGPTPGPSQPSSNVVRLARKVSS